MKYVLAENGSVLGDYDYSNDVYLSEKKYFPYDNKFYGECHFDKWLLSKAQVSKSLQHNIIKAGGVKKYYRLPSRIPTIGDCGAYTWIKEPEPLATPKEVLNFYEELGFDYGITLDHIVTDFSVNAVKPTKDQLFRYDLTIKNAEQMLNMVKDKKSSVYLIGALQGWDISSFEECLKTYAKMGFKYCAVGGLVSASNETILKVATALNKVALQHDIRLHILGFSRLALLPEIKEQKAVISFDATTPQLAPLKGHRNSVYFQGEQYSAFYIPLLYRFDKNGNITQKLTQTGKRLVKEVSECDRINRIKVVSDHGRHLCDLLKVYARGIGTRTEIIKNYREYLLYYRCFYTNQLKLDTELFNAVKLLRNKPWEQCNCKLCKEYGIELLIHRGTQRKTLAGAHNMMSNYALLNEIRAQDRKTFHNVA